MFAAAIMVRTESPLLPVAGGKVKYTSRLSFLPLTSFPAPLVFYLCLEEICNWIELPSQC